MDSKTLRRASVRDAFSCAIAFCVVVLLLSWLQDFLYNWLGVEYTPLKAVLGWGLGIVLYNCVSKDFLIGKWFAVGTSSGITLGLSIFFWPLPLQGIALTWISLYFVSYCASLIRITRLKKQGYTEELTERAWKR
jgi:putative effector of murein hydrolase LrgA (UPF0299 family)